MLIRFIFVILIIFLTKVSFADTVELNVSGWTQQQKNMTTAMAVKLLGDNTVKYDSISVNLPSINIINPSKDISAIITQQNIENAYFIWLADITIKQQQQQVIENAKLDEVNNSELKNITLAEIDAKINAISNLNEAKVFLKKLCRYIKAKE